MLAGRYRIVGLIGRGGMGEVYRADDLKLGQPVALKFLPPALNRDGVRLARFLNEVKVARQVSHANVCRVFDVGEHESQHYLSMEYVDGEDLASLLRRIGHLPKDKAVQISRQLCAGLAAAHEQGIVHRDLKPANVMIDGRGRAKITDFGLSGIAEGFEGDEIRAGTPAYMAPEQLAGKEVTSRSDIYSLGLVLYELFTGKPAFEAATPQDLMRLQKESTPASPSSHVEGFDPAVERILLRCLEWEPNRRPGSALAVAAALPGGDPLAAALAAGETPSPEMVAAAGQAEAMHPALALGLAVLAVVAFAAALWWSAGTQVRAYVSLDKPPAALADRAREVVRKLGYTEPLYSDPFDSASGFTRDWSLLRWIEEHDDSPHRWDRLRQSRLGAMTFWYRQSPFPLLPRASPWNWNRFSSPMVGIFNPFLASTGEILVVLDMRGRLEKFTSLTARWSDTEVPPAEPDWSVLFDLAEIDIEQFTPVEPRIRSYASPEVRAAWVGSLPDLPRGEARIEAGATDGRVVTFWVLDEAAVESASAGPEVWTGPPFAYYTVPATLLVLLVVGGFLARRNLRQGRADWSGAVRLASLALVVSCVSDILITHGLASRYAWILWARIIATGLFWAAMVWVFYLAVEPYARRIWPSMMVAWSRVVSSSTWHPRDPQVGRSVLAGVLAGAALCCVWPLEHTVVSVLQGVPIEPWMTGVLLGPRHALSELTLSVIWAMTASLGTALILVAARFIARRQVPAVLLAGAVLVLIRFPHRQTVQWTVIFTVLVVLWAAVYIGVLIRFGLVAMAVAAFVEEAPDNFAARDFTAWHGQPAILALVVVAAMAAYGFWAASGGRSLVREEPG
jgi:serine/threonine-protein kinase